MRRDLGRIHGQLGLAFWGLEQEERGQRREHRDLGIRDCYQIPRVRKALREGFGAVVRELSRKH
jgi:hypothetical protein